MGESKMLIGLQVTQKWVAQLLDFAAYPQQFLVMNLLEFVYPQLYISVCVDNFLSKLVFSFKNC